MQNSPHKIGTLCNLVGGSQPEKSTFIFEPKEGYVRLIQTRDYKTDNYKTYIRASETKKFCSEKDVMIGRYGPPVFQILRGLSGAYNVALMKADPKPNVSREFLYYVLKQSKLFEYIEHLSKRTGGQTGIDVDALKNYPILAPSNETEQFELIESLYLIDQKIALNNQINAELEAMAKLIYDYWFVQFDFPDEDRKPYKSSGGKMVWCKQLKREIPEGWETVHLGKVTRTILGGTPASSVPEYWEDGAIPWLSSGEVSEFPVVSSNDFVTEKGIQKSAAKVLAKGTTIVSIVRHLRVSFLAIEAATNQSVVGICENENLKSPFLCLMLQRDIPRLMTLRTGAQQPHINKEEVDRVSFAKPPADTLNMFYSIVQPSFEMIESNALQNQELASLRDWLLPMLMNGQVTVDN